MTSLDIRGTITGSVALAYKAPCLVATTSNITLNGAQTIDGVLVGNNSERHWRQGPAPWLSLPSRRLGFFQQFSDRLKE